MNIAADTPKPLVSPASETTKLSESEEMYLATIAAIQENSFQGPAPLSQVASRLDILPVSANQMVRKLEEIGLVTYLPYKGVDLTQAGRLAATNILRHRRLWEVFLVEYLHYLPEDAQPIACRLEHSLPAEAAERLAAYLGNPIESPSGEIIPAAQTAGSLVDGFPLSQLRLNETGLVVTIKVDSATRNFLELQGVRSGSRLTVLANSGSELLLASEIGKTFLLAGRLAEMIRVILGER